MGYKKESLMDCGYFYAPYPHLFFNPEEPPEYQELESDQEINIEMPADEGAVNDS